MQTSPRNTERVFRKAQSRPIRWTSRRDLRSYGKIERVSSRTLLPSPSLTEPVKRARSQNLLSKSADTTKCSEEVSEKEPPSPVAVSYQGQPFVPVHSRRTTERHLRSQNSLSASVRAPSTATDSKQTQDCELTPLLFDQP